MVEVDLIGGADQPFREKEMIWALAALVPASHRATVAQPA